MAYLHLLKPALAAALVSGCGGAWAALGDTAPSPLPAGTSTAPMRSGGGSPYQVMTRVLDSGTTVREYAGADGVVFAVTWAGPYLPDLRALLGAHFDTFKQAGSAVGRSSALSVDRDGVVIQSAGRMGAFQGRAWLARRLPAGLDPKEIR